MTTNTPAIDWDALQPVAVPTIPKSTRKRSGTDWTQTPIPRWIGQADGIPFTIPATRETAAQLVRMVRAYIYETLPDKGLKTRTVDSLPVGQEPADTDPVNIYFQVVPRAKRERRAPKDNAPDSGSQSDSETPAPEDAPKPAKSRK